MLEECSVQHHQTQTFRLASLPQNSLITSLLARGVDPANLYASVSVINRLQHPFTAEDVLWTGHFEATHGALHPYRWVDLAMEPSLSTTLHLKKPLAPGKWSFTCARQCLTNVNTHPSIRDRTVSFLATIRALRQTCEGAKKSIRIW